MNAFAEAHLNKLPAEQPATPLHPRDAIDVMSHDVARLGVILNDFDLVTERLDGPVIALKTTRRDFPASYSMAVRCLKEGIKKRADGRPFFVSGVKVKQLEDADKGFWGDYARHICEVTFLTPKK